MTDVYEHITKGVTRNRLKLEARRGLRPTIFWAGCLALGALGLSFFVMSVSQTFGRKTEEVTFRVSDTFGVFVGVDEVRFRGVPVGTIADVERDGTQLVLTAKIQKRYARIYRDAKAEMRSTTPLNDVYLNITDAGTAAAGKATASEPIREGQTKPLVTVPDVLETLREDQRAGLHILLDQLGNGLDDRGEKLRRVFVEAAPLLESAARVMTELDDRKAVTKRLVHNTAVLTGELGRRETELRRLVASGAATVGTLQRSTADLDSTLRELPPTLGELRIALQAVRRVADDVDAGLLGLNPVADELPDSLGAARKLGRSLAPAATALDPSVRALTPFAHQLRPTGTHLAGTVKALRPQVPTVGKVTQRLVDCMTGIQNFMQWNTSLTKFGDSDAPIPRGQLAIGVPEVPGREPETACSPGPVVTGRPMAHEDGH